MSEVELAIAAPHEREALANLMQLYVHDFSEQWWDRPEGELQDDGRFEPYPFLDDYWREADRTPLLIRYRGRLAGFALVNGVSHSGLPLDRNVAEFFVVRKHRRAGVGQAAAQAIFSRWPGVWEAAVARRNTGALTFWRKAVRGHPQARDIQELDFETAAWTGPILRFRIS